MNGSSDILSNLALHHNSQFRCRQPIYFIVLNFENYSNFGIATLHLPTVMNCSLSNRALFSIFHALLVTSHHLP